MAPGLFSWSQTGTSAAALLKNSLYFWSHVVIVQNVSVHFFLVHTATLRTRGPQWTCNVSCVYGSIVYAQNVVTEQYSQCFVVYWQQIKCESWKSLYECCMNWVGWYDVMWEHGERDTLFGALCVSVTQLRWTGAPREWIGSLMHLFRGCFSIAGWSNPVSQSRNTQR